MSSEPEEGDYEDDDDYYDDYDAEDEYGICDRCDTTYLLASAVDHCVDCGACWAHCEEPGSHNPNYAQIIADAIGGRP